MGLFIECEGGSTGGAQVKPGFAQDGCAAIYEAWRIAWSQSAQEII